MLGERLARAVAALPAGQRAVFILRDYHELEYGEIAAIMDLDEGTVGSRLARARATLRAALMAEGLDV
jgi:RNA polymerase sigma-70 factor, ECF subfamily